LLKEGESFVEILPWKREGTEEGVQRNRFFESQTPFRRKTGRKRNLNQEAWRTPRERNKTTDGREEMKGGTATRPVDTEEFKLKSRKQ